MNKALTQIIKCFLVILITSSSLFSQEKEPLPEIEKIYIHTDRSSYVAGESLWYKAYTVYAYNNVLFNHSNILYVELISSDSKIVARNKTKLVGGLGHGDFKLSDSAGIKPGKYQIRAYTNWSRNFGKDFVFKKDIIVLDVFNAETRNGNELSKISSSETETNSTPIKKEPLKLQFFPEGGSLIENVSSIVAFKAVDGSGNPINVQGKVFDSEGEIVAFFMSAHNGMGKFQLKPIKGKTYYAKITATNHSDIEVPIPNANQLGFLLSYKEIKGRGIITVKTNQETLLQHSDKPLTFHYKSRGVLYFKETQVLSSTKLLLELPKANLPNGISEITLFDAELKPQSQRLVYVEKNENLKVELTTNKQIYKPNEKVIVSVSSKSTDGEIIPASFSMASIDLNGAEELNDNSTNISSYFLMESDIRGKVHNPGYYFDSSNPFRFQHLDLLLLTQGWRDFLWKKDRKANDNPAYKVEKGINISGRVKHLFGSKPVVGNTISLALLNKRISNLNTVTDSLGLFKFEDLDIIGKARFILITKNKKGKKNGMFVLDSIFKAPMHVGRIDETNSVSLPIKQEQERMAQNVYKKHIEFNVLPENVLDEIEIVAEKIDSRENINIHGKMFQGYTLNEDSPSFTDIFELLAYAIPPLDLNNTELIRFSRNTGGALVVINKTRILDPADGGVTDYLRGIQPDDVLKIEYHISAVSLMMYGKQGENGVIMIYTKSNKDYSPKNTKDEFQTIKEQIEGFYEARTFYSPDLENIAQKSNKNASIRNTLYWNPYVHPNKTGVSQATYYNTKVESKVKVSIEGITASGIPVVVKTYYSVEE